MILLAILLGINQMTNHQTWTLQSYPTYHILDENNQLVELHNTLNSYHLMNEAMIVAQNKGISELTILDEDGKVLRHQQFLPSNTYLSEVGSGRTEIPTRSNSYISSMLFDILKIYLAMGILTAFYAFMIDQKTIDTYEQWPVLVAIIICWPIWILLYILIE